MAACCSSHPSFSGTGKITGLRTMAPTGYGNDGQINPRTLWDYHCTHVAGTVAGNRITNGMMFGNVYGANILAATINFSAGDFLWARDVGIDSSTTVSAPRQNIVDLANTGKVRIINNSWGVSTSAPYTLSLAQARSTFAQNLNGFYDPVLKNDVLVVFSAGNTRARTPAWMR